MKTKEEIKNWLVEKKIYGRWANARLKQRAIDVEHLFSLRLSSDMIDKSFTWAHTPEDHEFWSQVNDEFGDWYCR